MKLETATFLDKWFSDIVKKGKETTIITGLVLASIIGLCSFIWSKATPPAEEIKINAMQIDIKEMKDCRLNEAVEKAIMKNDILYLKNGFNKIDTKIDKLGDKMDENNRVIKSVNENTK